MNSMPRDEEGLLERRQALGLMALGGLGAAWTPVASAVTRPKEPTTMTTQTTLEPSRLAIGPIAANTASGNIARLSVALHQGLDQGLSISDVKEILVQLYAYAGFPRSLNALGEAMKVVEERRQKGIQDAPGRSAGPVPTGQALLEAGTATQTRLSGAPVKGPLFDFAPAIDQYLKTHLFGDIFARDNIDWQSRELATVAALASLSGVESQLQSHVRISMNVGLTRDQLQAYAQALGRSGETEAADRLHAALDKTAAKS